MHDCFGYQSEALGVVHLELGEGDIGRCASTGNFICCAIYPSNI